MKWIWLLYRRPRVFQEEANANGGKWRISGIVLYSALPWIYLAILVGAQVMDPRPWPAALSSAGETLAWKLVFPVAATAFVIGAYGTTSLWVPIGVAVWALTLRSSVERSLSDPLARVAVFGLAFGTILNVWKACSSANAIAPQQPPKYGWAVWLVVAFAWAPILYFGRHYLLNSAATAVMGAALVGLFATRAYYWPFALLFVWPRLRPEWYRWHPVA